MSSDRQPPPEDAYWRRPAEGHQTGAEAPGGSAPPTRYTGPPPTVPPPYGWRPPVIVRPPEPRALPPQDHAVLNVQEQSARTVTLGLTLVAGAVMLILLLVLCGRWLF